MGNMYSSYDSLSFFTFTDNKQTTLSLRDTERETERDRERDTQAVI